MIKTLLELSGLEVTALHRAVLLEAVVWLSMLAAVVIDFMTGIRKARALNIPRDSHGLRRSFRKFADYGKVTGMLMLVDLLAISFGVYTLPYASGLSALGVIYTEYRSVRENLAAIKSAGGTHGRRRGPARGGQRPERDCQALAAVQRHQSSGGEARREGGKMVERNRKGRP